MGKGTQAAGQLGEGEGGRDSRKKRISNGDSGGHRIWAPEEVPVWVQWRKMCLRTTGHSVEGVNHKDWRRQRS